MKLCEICGEELYTERDGENRCQSCEDMAEEKAAVRRAKARKARANRLAREAVLRDCGLVKVRGSMGGTYWE